MIRIYASKLSAEPAEVYNHKRVIIHLWLREKFRGYRENPEPRMTIDVNGRNIPHSEWSLCFINPEDNVDIRPTPYGGVIGGLFKVVATPIQFVFNLLGLGIDPVSLKSSPTGTSLDLSPAKANTAKLGDPIREVFGRCKVYPDYLVQPVSRFDKDNPQIFRTNVFLSFGTGNFSLNQSDIKIGNTPVSSFGEDVSLTIYPPGADVSGDNRADNWYNSPEVGGTTSGTSGLDLASTGPDKVSISADAISVSGNVISLIGETASDDDDDSDAGHDTKVPPSWVAGTILTVIAPDTFTVATESGHTVIYGDFTELVPVVGMAVSIEWGSYNYDLFIASYNAGRAAVPGVGGNAASVTASAAPTTYDFSSSAVAFTITWAGASHIISLSANYVTMSGLTEAITDQLTGTGLIAQNAGGKLQIIEPSSPYSGNSIGYTVLPSALFGASPVVVAGTASSGGTPEVRPSITLAYNSATGTLFSGMPAGTQRISIGAKGNQYQITAVDGLTITVERILEVTDTTTQVDANWPGFTERTLLDASVTGVNDDYSWMGPFQCCPDGEVTSNVEMNFVYPQGLVDIGSKDGKMHYHEVQMTIQYRLTGGTDWTSVTVKHGNTTVNEVGYTEYLTLPAAGNYEFRIKRDTAVWGGTTRDSVMWQAMRAKLSARPLSYKNITTIALTIRTGSRLAAQSDRRISGVGTRLYDGYTSRSISGALYHLLSEVGFTAEQINSDAIDSLENTYWTPRGETFDFAASDTNTSVKDLLDKATGAGMGYFLISDGLASAGREGIKPWVGIISPEEQTKELTTTFTAPSSDDYDGVDVKYINNTTWAEETLQCRWPDNPTPANIESYTLDGVTDQNRAYRIGMRRLLGYRYQSVSYSTATEMEALCYEFMDRVILADDIPGTTTTALITGMSYDEDAITLEVSELLDWSVANPRVLIRFQNGTASRLITPTRINDYSLTIPFSSDLEPDAWVMNHPSIEPMKLIFCSSEKAVYSALLTDITPDTDGTCNVSGIAYNELKYQYDDAVYPGDVS